MSHSPYATHASEEQAPFAGHPFGGLPRDDRFGVHRDLRQSAGAQPPANDSQAEATPSGPAASTFTSVSIRDFDRSARPALVARRLRETAMNIMPQTLNKLRAKMDRDLVAAPFSSLPEYKSITLPSEPRQAARHREPVLPLDRGPGRPPDVDRRQAGAQLRLVRLPRPQPASRSDRGVESRHRYLRHLDLGFPHGVGRYAAAPRAGAGDRQTPSASRHRSSS